MNFNIKRFLCAIIVTAVTAVIAFVVFLSPFIAFFTFLTWAVKPENVDLAVTILGIILGLFVLLFWPFYYVFRDKASSGADEDVSGADEDAEV